MLLCTTVRIVFISDLTRHILWMGMSQFTIIALVRYRYRVIIQSNRWQCSVDNEWEKSPSLSHLPISLLMFPPAPLQKQPCVSVLGMKRSNIITIALSSLPPPHLLPPAIYSMDCCVLDREDVQVCPTDRLSIASKFLQIYTHPLLECNCTPEYTFWAADWMNTNISLKNTFSDAGRHGICSCSCLIMFPHRWLCPQLTSYSNNTWQRYYSPLSSGLPEWHHTMKCNCLEVRLPHFVSFQFTWPRPH